jgi:hypothetical protein
VKYVMMYHYILEPGEPIIALCPEHGGESGERLCVCPECHEVHMLNRKFSGFADAQQLDLFLMFSARQVKADNDGKLLACTVRDGKVCVGSVPIEKWIDSTLVERRQNEA